jgi:hypothetical protein
LETAQRFTAFSVHLCAIALLLLICELLPPYIASKQFLQIEVFVDVSDNAV